jgi:hypothetical protein
MMYCIYEIKNNINNKTYIGQHKTNDLNDDYMGSGTILHQAYEKYGKENFTKTILVVAGTKENINILEKVFIQLYREQGKAEYNIANGGDGGSVLDFLSDEQIKAWKNKLSKKSKGHVLSYDARMKISKARTGLKFSDETRRKISEAGKGRFCSEETRRKRSISGKGKKHKPMSIQGRENIRKAHIGKPAWNKGKSTGMHWWNNGIENILSHECPEGFVAGRIGKPMSEEQKLRISIGTKKGILCKRKRK